MKILQVDGHAGDRHAVFIKTRGADGLREVSAGPFANR
jgi:hypothetical protein